MRPDRQQTERALDRLAADPVFEPTEELVRLLRFLISESVATQDAIKEVSVGVGFYNREPTYSPRHDSIVRVNVRRLRHRLSSYYAGTGAGEVLRFEIPMGSYRVVTHWSEPAPLNSAPAAPSAEVAGPRFKLTDQTPKLPKQGSPAPARITRRASPFVLWGPGAAGVVLLVATLLFAFWPKKQTTLDFAATNLKPEPLTIGGGMEFEPSTTRDGMWLAYVARPQAYADYRILLRPFSSLDSRPAVLNTGSGDAFYPEWSPDGREIAFLRCGDSACDIATVPANGGAVKSVKGLPTYNRPVDAPYYQYRQLNAVWTRDGDALIFPYKRAGDPSERLIVHDLHAGAERILTKGADDEEDEAPAISHDGRTVAYLRRQQSQTQVMIVDLHSLREQVLETEPNLAVSGLTWGPDDAGVLAGINRNAGGQALRWIPLKGTAVDLNIHLPLLMNPVLAGDGKTLMFVAPDRTRNLAQVAGLGTPSLLFASRQRNTFTSASPDGKRLAFLSTLSGQNELWVMDRLRGGWSEAKQVTHGLEFFPSSLTWSPDGRFVAVGISNTADLFVVDIATGRNAKLAVPGLERSVLWSPQWSADGRWIYMSVWGERNGIYRAATGPVPDVQQIYQGSAREIRLDGNHALYFGPNYGNGLLRLPLSPDGGPAAGPPAPVPGLEHLVTGRAWLVSEGKLLYIDARDEKHTLQSLDPATGQTRELTGSLPRVAYTDGTISWFPAERMLVYSQWSEGAGAQVLRVLLLK